MKKKDIRNTAAFRQQASIDLNARPVVPLAMDLNAKLDQALMALKGVEVLASLGISGIKHSSECMTSVYSEMECTEIDPAKRGHINDYKKAEKPCLLQRVRAAIAKAEGRSA